MKNLMFAFLFFCSISSFAQLEIKTNSVVIDETLEEFADAVEFYQVDYQPKIKHISKILLVEANRDFISSNENGIIKINSRFSAYPELLRIQVFQVLGKIYGLKYDPVGRSYMSILWQDLTLQNELFALRHHQRPNKKMDYLQALKLANPIKYKRI